MGTDDKNKRLQDVRARGIYLLPNLLTTVSLFSGFYAIIAALKGRFSLAAMAIFLAMVMDYLDGLIARLTKTQTLFGAQYDSLSDMVSFGLAPALIVYSWALMPLGKIGWLVSFFYTAAAALRLARYNTQIQNTDKRYFQGLPSPTAAMLIGSLTWLLKDYDEMNFYISCTIAVITLFVGFLMVSNVRYRSLKEIRFAHKIKFVYLLGLILGFILISTDPPLVIFTALAIYTLSGPILTLIKLHKTRRLRKARKKSLH